MIKNIQILMISLFYIGVSAQNLSEINSDLKLSDSLTYEAEIRIYKGRGITNYSSLFRIFKNNSNKWTMEFYEHYSKVNEQVKLRTEKRILTSKNDMEFIFQNLIRSHILNLPSLNDIDWKLSTRGHVDKRKQIHRGKTTEEYDFSNKKTSIVDGEGFKVQVKIGNKYNEFEYSNPDSYLKIYPEIDELIYMSEILNLIRTEFHIWKE